MPAESVRQFNRALGITAGLVVLIATPLWAHSGSGAASGLLHGMAHPLAGTDHLLAMIAVGLWAAQGEMRRVWLLPLAFVAAMLTGGVIAMWGVALPAVEATILLSIVVLGALVAVALRPATVVSVFIVAAFGLFHGHAHGTEIPAAMSAVGYAAGFLTATALLHATAAATAILVKRAAGNSEGMTWVRVTGSAIAAAGLLLAVVG